MKILIGIKIIFFLQKKTFAKTIFTKMEVREDKEWFLDCSDRLHPNNELGTVCRATDGPKTDSQSIVIETGIGIFGKLTREFGWLEWKSGFRNNQIVGSTDRIEIRRKEKLLRWRTRTEKCRVETKALTSDHQKSFYT